MSDRERLMPDVGWDWSIPVPFSQGWRVGDLVFVGGQISADKSGTVVGEGDIEVQTRNVFESITTVLRSAGAEWPDVVKLNTYYVFDGDETQSRDFWEKMTRVRLKYLSDPGPAATAVRVSGLAYPGLLIEVEAIAVLSEKQS